MRWILVVGLAAVATMQATAGGLQRQQVAANSAWVVHMDIEQFNKTQMASLVAEDATNIEAQVAMGFLRTALDLDPLKDLTSATIYGDIPGSHEGVALVRGRLNVPHIETTLKADANYDQLTYNGRILHKWVDRNKGKPGVVAFVGENLAVLGPSFDKVKAALDVIDGRAPCLQENGLRGLDSPDAYLLVSSTQTESGAAQPPRSTMFQNAEWMTLSLGETAGQASGTLTLAAKTPENAAQIEQVVRGMIAFMLLSKEQNPAVAEMAQGLSVTSQNNIITVQMSGSARALHDVMKAQGARR